VCAEGGVSFDKMPDGKAWKARYDAKFPGQFQIYGPYVYDAVMTLADAMQKANSSDPKVYLPVLAKIDHQGVTARIQFDDKGDLKIPAMTLSTYKDGKKVPLN